MTSANTATDRGVEKGDFIPIGSIIPFSDSTVPSGWLLTYGQPISRTTYKNLFAILCPSGNCSAWGNGDGSTTFNAPDFRGRTLFGKDNMGGVAAGKITAALTIDGTILGNSGGSQTQNTNVSILAHPSYYIPQHYHSNNGNNLVFNSGHVHPAGTSTANQQTNGQDHTHSVTNMFANMVVDGNVIYGNEITTPNWTSNYRHLHPNWGAASHNNGYGIQIGGTTGVGGNSLAAMSISFTTSGTSILLTGNIGNVNSANNGDTNLLRSGSGTSLTNNSVNNLAPVTVMNYIIKY